MPAWKMTLESPHLPMSWHSDAPRTHFNPMEGEEAGNPEQTKILTSVEIKCPFVVRIKAQNRN